MRKKDCKMDKAEKKRLLKNWKDAEKEKFEDTIPMPREKFKELFDYLDDQLETNDCIHDLRLTVEFLNNHQIPVEPVIEFLQSNGGYCDCEVLMNVEDRLENCLF